MLLIPALLMTFPSAHADCVGGTRKRTAEELSFARQVADHLLAAMPAPPPNMWLEKEPEVQIDPNACRDTPVGAMGAYIRAVYDYRMPADEAKRVNARRDALSEQMQAVHALPPELKAEFDGFNASYFAAIREAKQAERAGDAALANRKYGEAGDFERKAKAVEQRHRTAVKAQYETLERESAALPSDRLRLGVLMTVNGLFNDNPRASQITYRVDDNDLKGKSMAFRVRFVQAVVSNVDGGGGVNVGGVTVYRNMETLDTLLSAIDRSRLQVLIQNPLPAAAAPVAWRVGKQPQNTAETAAGASAQAPAQTGGVSTTAAPAQQPASPTAGKPTQQAQQQPAQPPEKPATQTDQTAEKAKEVVNKLRGLLKF